MNYKKNNNRTFTKKNLNNTITNKLRLPPAIPLNYNSSLQKNQISQFKESNNLKYYVPNPNCVISLETEPHILCFDLDETLGCFRSIADVRHYWLRINKCEPCIKDVVEYFKKNHDNDVSCFRPGLKQLINTSIELYYSDIITEIIIFTSASNENGYVTFMLKCISEYCSQPLIDIVRIITRNECREIAYDGATKKDLRYVVNKINYPNANYNTNGCIMVDDRAHNIVQDTIMRKIISKTYRGDQPIFYKNKNIIQISPYNCKKCIINFMRKNDWWDKEIETKMLNNSRVTLDEYETFTGSIMTLIINDKNWDLKNNDNNIKKNIEDNELFILISKVNNLLFN